MEQQTELDNSSRSRHTVDNEMYLLQVELERLQNQKKSSDSKENEQFKKMKEQNESNARKIEEQEKEIAKMKNYLEMMKVERLQSEIRFSEHEAKIKQENEEYVSTLKNEIKILINELQISKIQAEMEYKNFNEENARKIEVQENEIQKLKARVIQLQDEKINSEMQDNSELERLREEKRKLETNLDEKDRILREWKEKNKELEEELRVLKSTNNRQEKRINLNVNELEKVKFEKDDFMKQLKILKADFAKAESKKEDSEQNELQSLREEDKSISKKMEQHQIQLAQVQSQKVLADAEIQKLTEENADLLDQLDQAEENKKMIEDFEEKLDLANRNLEKYKMALHWYQNPAIYSDKIRRFEKENGLRKTRKSENRRSMNPNPPLAPISEPNSDQIRRVSQPN